MLMLAGDTTVHYIALLIAANVMAALRPPGLCGGSGVHVGGKGSRGIGRPGSRQQSLAGGDQ